MIDSKTLRRVAGAFPTGVTVITVDKEDGTTHGMTASSFLSVSLDPPLISFCLKENSKIFPLCGEGKPIGISILAENQKAISNQFAGFNKEAIKVNMTKTNSGVSVIENSLAWYSTTVNQIVPVGDHYLVLCDIKEVFRNEEGNPLVYWSGYRTVSENI